MSDDYVRPGRPGVVVEEYVTPGVIGDRLGVTRQAVHNWRARYDDFPAEVPWVVGTRVYSWRQVREWRDSWRGARQPPGVRSPDDR